MKNWWLLIVGFLFGLWWTERRKNQPLMQTSQPAQPVHPAESQSVNQPSQHRTLEELSPLYAKENAAQRSLYDYIPQEIAKRTHQLIKELVQPALTVVEAERVVTKLAQDVPHLLRYQEAWQDKVEDALDDRHNGRFTEKFEDVRQSTEYQKMEQEIVREYYFSQALEELPPSDDFKLTGDDNHEQGTTETR